jgi:hypothetical protein
MSPSSFDTSASFTSSGPISSGHVLRNYSIRPIAARANIRDASRPVSIFPSINLTRSTKRLPI